MKRGFTPCGDVTEPVFGYSVDKNGRKIFGQVGTTNVYEKIQASVTGSTLYEMIEKYQRTGDDSFLRTKAKGFYADVTNVPRDIYEIQRVKTMAIQDFEKYPVEFKAQFNHDVENYFESIMNNTIKEKFDTYFKKKGVEVKTEVKIDEQVAK